MERLGDGGVVRTDVDPAGAGVETLLGGLLRWATRAAALLFAPAVALAWWAGHGGGAAGGLAAAGAAVLLAAPFAATAAAAVGFARRGSWRNALLSGVLLALLLAGAWLGGL